jgi:hypothetical protein
MKKKVASKVVEEKNKTNQEIKVCNIEETNQFFFSLFQCDRTICN